jgi:hypothetical protein
MSVILSSYNYLNYPAKLHGWFSQTGNHPQENLAKI